MLKKKEGVTLIALVVTIIVLVILATVSIGMVLGNQGIFKQAEEAKKLTANAQVAEEEGFNELYEQLQGIMNGENVEPPTPEEPAIETTPYMPEGSTVIENSTLDTGLTIKDKNNNEWVWVIVPKSITKTATTKEEIYTVLEDYAVNYRQEGYMDEWYNGCGLTEAQYNSNTSKMLNSIKTYGGFWIGRYELGTETQRKTGGDTLTTALVQPDKFVYNYITCSQAQEKCSNLSTETNITSSMIFGIQWDLTLKYVEEKAIELGTTIEERQTKLKTDSSTWGNYNNITFDMVKGKYSTDYGQTYTRVSGSYIKPLEGVLVTTGANTRNSILNIYDLAGNEIEWTLEKRNLEERPCGYRGGYYNTKGSELPSVDRNSGTISLAEYYIASRPVLYK